MTRLVSNQVRKGSSSGEAHGERREALEERTCMLPTIIEKSLNPAGESARPGLEPESHPSAAEPPRSVQLLVSASST